MSTHTEQPTRTRKTIETIWEVWTYDVWGNAEDGYEVNDRSCLDRAYRIRCRVEVNNPGTSAEFESATPSDYQIKRLFGVSCGIETDGDDLTIYVNRARDGYPIGELSCQSHKSLSPVRAVDVDQEVTR